MKNSSFKIAWPTAVLACLFAPLLLAEGLDPALQAKVDVHLKEAQLWATEPTIVKTVEAYNRNGSADSAQLTQEKWKGLSVLDPMVRNFSRNEAAQFLKQKKGPAVLEAFLSGANGCKVAFLGKPSNWSHLGKPKHDIPMTGKTWQGSLEVDESTGFQQLQVAVPVKDGAGKSIGSLVIGLSLSKL